MPDLPRRFRANTEEVAAKVIDGEAIIINLTTGVYYSMDGLGGKIWSLLEDHHDVDSIVESILSEYEVPADQCRTDVLGLASQLLEEDLVLASDQPPSSTIEDNKSESKLEYITPELNIYRDMGDLLALDPPVPGLEPIPWDDPAASAPERPA